MALKHADLPDGERGELAAIKGQMEANRKSHDDYVAARAANDKAGMDTHKPGFEAFEQYAEQYRTAASAAEVSGEPDENDIPAAITAPSERNVGSVPSKPDKDAPAPLDK